MAKTKSMIRSLEKIKEYGWLYDIVEQPYNRYTKKKKTYSVLVIFYVWMGKGR